MLFAEDFDDITGVTVIEAPSEPEIIAPTFTAADFERAREQAFADGRAAAHEAAEAAHRENMRAGVAAIAAALDAAALEQAALAAREAEELARLLLDTLMTMLPTLCARHGETEVRGVARAVLPALLREKAISVRVAPHLAPAVGEEIERIDSELAARVRIVPSDGMGASDVRIGWTDGAAVRDAGAVWNEIAGVLSQAGLLMREPAPEDASGR